MHIVEELLPHMRRVQVAERDLRDLSLLWQMIEASSAIGCPDEADSILSMISQTRSRFAALQVRLVEQLGEECLAELRDELGSAAKCTIDILVRNLYERTADVGFLATDEVLCEFCAADASAREPTRARVEQRLAEYRAKYTVYDDIILLGVDGSVLARLDHARPVTRVDEPMVAGALANSGYVEQYASTGLAATDAPALCYAHQVRDTRGVNVGVLVLRFRNADEMQRIFTSVNEATRQVALVLLDQNDRVIASNDESHVALGATVQTAAEGEVALTVFAGREYLSVTQRTQGYQGYVGPKGWRAHAMVSLLTAFRSRHHDQQQSAQLTLDNAELSRIQSEVDAINADLRRVVWNGRLMAGAASGSPSRLKAVLTQVNDAGLRTRGRVAAAIEDLFRTSLGRSCHQARELARLAADIMDRNLYERANDCRWWALSPVAEKVLASAPDAGSSAALSRMLAHVNSLYTVYTQLVAFDAQGVIRAVSNDTVDESWVGRSVDNAWVARVAGLTDTQRYAVSEFEGCVLSGGVPTYVYLAAVRSQGRHVGGMAIVFNAEREFRAMLSDVLGGRNGLAAFVDEQGRILSSTDPALAVGSAWPFDGVGVASHGGSQYAVACVEANGYREFKQADGYQNGVKAAVALRLGSVERRATSLTDKPVRPLPVASRARMNEFALFHVGSGRYALPAGTVIEALPKDGLVRSPMAPREMAGLLEVPSGRDTQVVPVLCARRLFDVSYPARATDGVVLILRSSTDADRPVMGLLVDAVDSVVDVGHEYWQPAPQALRTYAPLLDGLLRLAAADGDGELLVQLVDAVGLVQRLAGGPAAGTGAGEPSAALAAQAQAKANGMESLPDQPERVA